MPPSEPPAIGAQVRDAEVIEDESSATRPCPRSSATDSASRTACRSRDRSTSARSCRTASPGGSRRRRSAARDRWPCRSRPARPTSPASRPRVAVLARRVRAGGQRVADEDRVRAVGVQLAERLIDDRERRDGLPVLKAKAVRQHQLLRRTGRGTNRPATSGAEHNKWSNRRLRHHHPQNDVDDDPGERRPRGSR